MFEFDKKSYGIPCAELHPKDIPTSKALLSELVHSVRIEYFAETCSFGEKEMNRDYMAAHYEFRLSSAPVLALIDEATRRAIKGCMECQEVIDLLAPILPRKLPQDSAEIATIVSIHDNLYAIPRLAAYLPRPRNMGPAQRPAPFVRSGVMPDRALERA